MSSKTKRILVLWTFILFTSIISLFFIEKKFVLDSINDLKSSSSSSSLNLDPRVLRSSLDGLILVDVREKSEIIFDGHHPNCIILPLSSLQSFMTDFRNDFWKIVSLFFQSTQEGLNTIRNVSEEDFSISELEFHHPKKLDAINSKSEHDDEFSQVIREFYVGKKNKNVVLADEKLNRAKAILVISSPSILGWRAQLGALLIKKILKNRNARVIALPEIHFVDLLPTLHEETYRKLGFVREDLKKSNRNVVESKGWQSPEITKVLEEGKMRNKN